MERIVSSIIDFMFTDYEEYEPLNRCNRTFWLSLIGFFLSIILSIITIIKGDKIYQIMIMIAVILLVTIILTIISGCNIIKKLDNNDISTDIITIISINHINGIIKAVTPDDNYEEYLYESDIKVNKNNKYIVNYYIKGKDKIISHAEKISTNKKKKNEK